jgi:quercetin dioxygenase-like cupin family protein
MMSEPDNASTWPSAMIPPDDPKRQFTIADPDGPRARHVSVSGGTYTILVTSGDSAGRYCLIDMLVPPGSGPPPHRHDFEEMFTLLEGELEFTFRDQKSIIRAGSTVNVPANAPHFYKNISGGAARMLCMCTPPGQEEFFMAIGDPVDARTAPPPNLTEQEREQRRRKARELGPKYRTEYLKS